MKKSLLQLYFALVAAISLFVGAVNLSILFSNVLEYYFISWEEYKKEHFWELRVPCEKVLESKQTTLKNQHIDPDCIKKNEEMLYTRRKTQLKKTVITTISFTIVFFLIFFIHYRELRKTKSLQGENP